MTLTSASAESAVWTQTVRSGARGFFQFKGLAPGDYAIRGHAKGLMTQSEQVKILARSAAELNAPLLLDTPKRLTVTIMPRADSAGSRWSVRLLSNQRRLRHADVVAESLVGENGEWTHPGLVAGDYTVQLVSSKGEYWVSKDVVVAQEDLDVTIAAVPAKISGSVHLGERPLEASLSFGGESGPRIRTGSDGQFTGDLPAGEDRRDWTILVEADTPRVRRNVHANAVRDEAGRLRLDLRLPPTTLMGRVLRKDRSPEPHAFLDVSKSDRSGGFDQVPVERDGGFQIGGFDPGSYRVMADGENGKSREVEVALREGESTEVELVLESAELFRGHITMGEAPVIAADVYAFPRDATAPFIPRGRTNEGGTFEIEMPPGTTVVDTLVIQPAFDVVFARTALQRDKQLRIQTEQEGGTVVVESRWNNAILLHGGAQLFAQWLASVAGGTINAGRMTIPRLRPGHYSACTYDQSKCVSGFLAPRGTLSLALN